MISLVTGASGFLGATLTRRLAGLGHSVRAFVRPTSSLDLLNGLAEHVDIHRGDILETDALDRSLESVEHVYHCAAAVSFGGRRRRRQIMQTNVYGTAAVVDAARRAGVARLVHVSSIAALGRPDVSTGCLDESATWTESKLNTTYAQSKYLAELEVHRAIAEGLDAVIVNPAVIFGPGRSGDNTMRIVDAVRSGRVRRYPVGGTSVVDVDDVVDGILSAAREGATGRRYVLAGQNLSWKDILTVLAGALGVSPPTRAVSPGLMRLALPFAHAWSLVRGDEPALTAESVRLSAATTCYDHSRAASELGWTPRPFEQTADRIAKSL